MLRWTQADGGDAYVRMRVAKRLGQKKVLVVPRANVSTMNVNEVMDYLVGKATGGARR